MLFLNRALRAIDHSEGTMGEGESAADREMAQAAGKIAAALKQSGYEADFSMDSLREIDRFFDEQSQDGKPVEGGLLSKDLGRRLYFLGAYAGEVVRQNVGGRWVGNPDDRDFELSVVLKLPGGTSCWPTQRVIKRLRNGDSEGVFVWGQSCEALRRPDRRSVGLESASGSADADMTSRRGWAMLLVAIAVWLLMAFMSAWFSALWMIGFGGALVLATILLAGSFWQSLRHALKHNPSSSLFFLFPLYFVRYGIRNWPETKRPVISLLSSLSLVLASFLLFLPVRAAGMAVAGALGGGPAAAAQAPAAPQPQGAAAAANAGPGKPPARIASIDDAVVLLKSDRRYDQLGALDFLSRVPVDAARTDVAPLILSKLHEPIHLWSIQSVVRWATPAQYAEMRLLIPRVDGMRLEYLLNGMLEIDRTATLSVCSELLSDRSNSSIASKILNRPEPEIEQLLLSLLDSPSAEARRNAADLLGRNGTATALAPLQQQLDRETDRLVQAKLRIAVESVERRSAGTRSPRIP